MAIYDHIVNKFNRGEVSANALGRTEDVERIRDTCESMVNFIPLRLGPMMYRPGLGYLNGVAGQAYCIPFIASASDYAIIEFSNNLMRVWVSDALITRTSVTSAITNGTFAGSITGWTDNSGAGSSTSYDAGTGGLKLTGAGTTAAVSYQTIGSTDTGNEHAIRIVVVRGPVVLQLGTSGVGSTDIAEETLLPGTHSLVFTPGSNVTITFSNSNVYSSYVTSVSFEATGTFSLPTEVTTANLSTIRYAQSADVVFLVASGSAIKRIERRGVKSWSVVDFRADDGPFRTINTSEITLTAAALNGDTTLTASDNFFTSSHVGALFKLTSSGQNVSASVSAEDSGTNSIRVTGISSSRTFTINITGTFSATVTLQRSADGSVWEDTTSTWTAPVSTTFNDATDNAVYYYRLYVKTGAYSSGTADLELVYAAGSIDGIARVVSYSSATVVNVQVLQDFGSTSATRNWYEGEWSTERGFPSAVALYEGRLWLAGKDQIFGSVSDAFSSFDDTLLGDSVLVRRTIGFGPVDTISWLEPSTRMIMGVATAEISVRSSTFGEPLTNDNTNLKAASTQGVAPQQAIQIDDIVYFVQRSGTKIYEAAYAVDRDAHIAKDLMLLHEDICAAGITRIAVSRQPETRIWVVLDDGNARCYLLDRAEEVKAWSKLETEGNFEDVVVLPGTAEDQVYFVVNRTSGRYLEKMAKFSEVLGESTSKHFDSFKVYNSPGTSISDLSHVEGKTVHVWADGQYRESATVSSGAITLSASWTNVVIGLRYTADYVSNKVSRYSNKLSINREKRIVDVGLIMRNYWPGSVQIGPSTALLEAMPDIEEGTAVVSTATQTDYDHVPFEFNGDEETDPRIYIQANNPTTILALTYTVIQNGDDSPADAQTS